MSAWGAATTTTRSTNGNNCDSLLERIERNDASLPDLILLPMKKMDDAGWNRLIVAISARRRHHGSTTQRCLTSIQASGHGIASHATLTRLGRAIHATSVDVPWKCIAVGKSDMGDDGVVALCTGLAGGGGDDGDSISSSSNKSSTISSSSALLQLEALDLSFKGMKTGAGLLSMIQLCQDCTFLKHVNLSRNAGGCHQGGVLENFMVNHHHGVIFPHVEDLDLSSCNITGQVGAQLLNSLSGSENLSILRLSNNPLFGSITAAAAAAATAALGLILQRLPALRELHLSNCQLDDETMQALPWTTDEQTSLQVLDLSMNQISANGDGGGGGGGGGIHALALGLATSMTSLVDLNLAGNPLLFEGVECLVCNGLVMRREQQQQQQQQQSSSSSLQSLDLSETKCTGPGAALAIAQSGVQKSLRLYNNDLQANHGFETNIAPCLVGGHVTMECLDLSGNGANEAAVVNLLRGLLLEQVNENDSTSKLQTLIVGGNEGGDSVEEVVRQIRLLRPGLDIARDKRGSRMQS